MPTATYYHRTTQAEAIIRGGFRDGSGSYMTAHLVLTGVFVSDRPLDINEGAGGEHLLAIDLGDDLTAYELVEDGKPYREWCVPSAILNGGHVRLVSREDEDALSLERWSSGASITTPLRLVRMTCTATSDPAADLDAQQCDEPAVALVSLTSDEARLTGRVCALHVDGALAWLHALGVGTVGLERLA